MNGVVWLIGNMSGKMWVAFSRCARSIWDVRWTVQNCGCGDDGLLANENMGGDVLAIARENIIQ